jgi:hypothetical protein
MRRALLGALGPPGRGKDRRWSWFEVDKVFRLWTGSELYVRTADDKEGVPTRGLTIDGILWVDEAAYVPREAWEAARMTQAAVVDPPPLVIITTTPCGRNWVFDEFQAGCPGEKRRPMNESFRFRTTDSPYHNPQFVRDLREKVGPRKASQELDAEFLGDAHAAFDPEHVAALFAPNLTIRGEQFTLGVDLGKEQDYTVCTLMNEFGETWVLGRWRDMEWPAQEERIVGFGKKHKALVVVAMGAGGGYGGMMASRLKPVLGEARVLEVQDASMGVRGELFELLIADVQARRLKVETSELGQILRHELTFFEAHRQIVGGRERWKYHGPEGVARDDDDEENEDHDDAVLSLALANWGRMHGWTTHDPCKGDHTGFMADVDEPPGGPSTSSASDLGGWAPL